MLKKLLYIKYGELCLKGKNRKDFTKCLNLNLKYALEEFKSLEYEFYYDYILIKNVDDNQIDQIINIIKLIPGFSYISVVYQTIRDLDKMNELINKLINQEYDSNLKITFKIDSHRSDKKYEHTSDEIKRIVAKFLLQNNSFLTVDIHDPILRIYIDVKNDSFLIYFNKLKCENGLPVGSSGRILMMISGGIDSPVAARLLFNRGFNIDFITFITPPHTSDELITKIKSLINQVTINNKIQKNTRLYVCNFTNIQNELTHISKQAYRINLLRRSFLRISKSICDNFNYQAIATGEALGQVASQTIESMKAINSSLNDFLVLRPLLVFNKEEIISLSKKYGLYDISILPFCDSCSLFAPNNPVTKPKAEIAHKLENELPLLETLEKKAIEKIEIIDFKK